MKHLPIGGSTAPRTINCPSWLERSKKFPKPPGNIYADTGKLIHDALEQAISNDKTFDDMLGKLKYNDITLAREHRDMFDSCLAQAQDVMDQYDVNQYWTEAFVEIEPDKIGGSIDLMCLSSDRQTLVIADFKTGMHAVAVQDNLSLQFYALAATLDPQTAEDLLQVKNIAFVIIQPQVCNTPMIWEQPISVLDDFETKLDWALANPEHAAIGDHCKYCPAAPACPEKKAQGLSALLLEPDTADEVSEALDLAHSLDTWIKDVMRQGYELADRGASIPGYKLVEKRPTRKWVDEQAVEDVVRANRLGVTKFFTHKLVSPTQVAKLKLPASKQALFDELTVKRSSGTTLVGEADKREAVAPKEITESLKKKLNL